MNQRISKNSKINNEETIRKFEKLLRKGRHIETACEIVGCHKTLFYFCLREWQIYENEDFKEFATRIEKARADFKQKAEDCLIELAIEDKDPRAIQFLLSKKYPRHWGDKSIEDKIYKIYDNLFFALEKVVDSQQLEDIKDILENKADDIESV